VLPKAKVLDHSARVPGTDGEKMSKSYHNTLAVFEEAKVQQKQIMRIATDSRPMDEPKEPAGDVLFDLFSLVASESDRDEMAALYRRGGFGYGDVKKKLASAAEQFFAEARARRTDWESRPDDVRALLGTGAATARAKAAEVLARAQAACGLKGY
jgi:tryptophanyl-tRNA synthetase